MSRRKDIRGEKYGSLAVVSYSHNDKHGNAHWICNCECGREITARSNNLTQGKSTSCGCTRTNASTFRAQKSDYFGEKSLACDHAYSIDELI